MQIPWNKGIKYSEEQKNKFRGIEKKVKRFGCKSPNWRGGKRNTRGYISIFSPLHPNASPSLKLVAEHRLIAEKELSRFLTQEECIHHINFIKNDNRLENLYLFDSKSSHQKYHRLLKSNKKLLITKSNIVSSRRFADHYELTNQRG
jgi:hypothetical protein